MITKELLEEAAIRFPIGCKIRNHNIIPGCTTLIKINSIPLKSYNNLTIVAHSETGSTYTVYHPNTIDKWAIRVDLLSELIIPQIFN